MATYRVMRTAKRGRPLTRAELVLSKIEAANESQAVIECLKRYPAYKADTLVAIPNERQAA